MAMESCTVDLPWLGHRQYLVVQAGADDIAGTIDAHVDDGLCGTLVLRRDRRVEKLIPGPEDRATKNRLAPAGQHNAPESWDEKRCCPAEQKCQSRSAGGGRQTESLQGEPAAGRLDEEGDQAERGVVAREEACPGSGLLRRRL